MNRKKIIWRKWKNPLILSTNDGEEVEAPQLLRHTPFGVTTLRANSESEMNFRMYVGNTNFDITNEILKEIEDIDGVDILECFSPYQFRISIGQAFVPRLVCKSITKKLCENKKEIVIDKHISEIYQKFNQTDKKWLIYVLPNGKYEALLFDQKNDWLKSIKNYQDVENKIGGYILASE